jgi:hypothetical protein
MCEACTHFCCLRFSLSVRAFLFVSSFFFFVYVEASFLKKSYDLNSSSYSSTLAYIVDANNGRSSPAVAVNSAFRGVFTFVAMESAVPLQVRHYNHSHSLKNIFIYIYSRV